MRVFDSNAVIYYLNGSLSGPTRVRLDEWVREEAAISVITRIEVLGFSQPEREERRAQRFVSVFREVPVYDPVVRTTISLRRSHSISVPDAIIAATALDLEGTLVTRNVADFDAIEGLQIRNPFDR